MQCGCIRAKWFYFGQEWLYSGKVVVFWQSGCIRAKVDVFGQKLLHLRKKVVFAKKW